MALLKRRDKRSLEQIDSILKAVVSVYLYMAKTQKLDKDEINKIDAILISLFGKEIPLYLIEQSHHHIRSVRAAANILNRSLSSVDKITLLMNLLSLAYHNRFSVQVLSNVEIVEIVDLLRIDIALYERIYNFLIEGKEISLQLEHSYFMQGKRFDLKERKQVKHYLNNSIILSSNGDVSYKGRNISYIILILIEPFILISCCYDDPQGETENYLSTNGINTQLEHKKFYRVTKESTIELASNLGEIAINYAELVKLFYYFHNNDKLSYEYVVNGKKLIINFERPHFYIGKGFSFFRKKYSLDETLMELQDKAFIDYFLNKGINPEQLPKKAKEHFLLKAGAGYSISPNTDAEVIAKFQKKFKHLEQKENETYWTIEPVSGYKVALNGTILEQETNFTPNKDIISDKGKKFIVSRNWELIYLPIEINTFKIEDVYYRFTKPETVAVNNVSLALNKGEMMAIMGPSGCGKTTLLKILMGEIALDTGKIEIDNRSFSFYQQYLGYVPQDDLLFPNLSVYANLYYYFRLRMPQIKDKFEINNRISNILKELGLYEYRKMKVGDPSNKKLSGGQRKRLNIALELICNPMLIILDEPTSGLSSKDSEKIIEVLTNLKEHGKIIIVSIHQPNASLLQKFDKLLLLDKGGVQVYFGSTKEVFDYFTEELQIVNDNSLYQKKRLLEPEFIFDIVEYQDSKTDEAVRLFNPEHWYKKFRGKRLADIVEESGESKAAVKKKSELKSRLKYSVIYQTVLLILRNFNNKLHNKINLSITLIVAPALALVVSLILRHFNFNADFQDYSFNFNPNAEIFAFVSIIIFIFIGLVNSIDDILSEKMIIVRELKLGVKPFAVLFSKSINLFIMTFVQAFLFYLIASAVLQFKGYSYSFIAFTMLSGIIGYSFGLFASVMINERGAAVNILPIILIPQIMLAGALIPFKDMNKSLRFNERFDAPPEFCYLIPSKWLYEGMIVSLAEHNFYTRTIAGIDENKKAERAEFSKKYERRYYTNKYLDDKIMIRNRQFKNSDKNIFMASHRYIMGRVVGTVSTNTAVLFLFIAALHLLTYIKLKRLSRL